MSEGTAPASSGGAYTPKTVGQVISATFEVYKEHFVRLMTVSAFFVIPVAIVGDLLIYLVIVTGISLGGLGGLAVGGTLGIVLAILVFALVEAGISRGAASALVGDPGVEASFSYGMKRMGSLLWITVLVGLIVASPAIVGLLLIWILPGIWFLLSLLIMVGVIFVATMLAVAIPSLVIENRRGTEALTRSWELVKGHFWHVFGSFLVAGLIYFVADLVVTSILGAAGNAIVQIIGDILVWVVALPFWAIVAVVIYVDLRSRVENVTPDMIRAELQASS